MKELSYHVRLVGLVDSPKTPGGQLIGYTKIDGEVVRLSLIFDEAGFSLIERHIETIEMPCDVA